MADEKWLMHSKSSFSWRHNLDRCTFISIYYSGFKCTRQSLDYVTSGKCRLQLTTFQFDATVASLAMVDLNGDVKVQYNRHTNGRFVLNFFTDGKC